VYKPAGIVVSGNRKYTLENALSYNLQKSKQKDALLRPEPVHRLDYPTSGLILIGKTSEALIKLNAMFESKTIAKTYYAVSVGYLKDSGIIEAEIENKKCKTHFIVRNRKESRKYGSLNLVELNPLTGRKHQLRIHLALEDSPILGDDKYGQRGRTGKGNGLYLHASGLRFAHPITGEHISESMELPKKFKKLFPEFRNLD